MTFRSVSDLNNLIFANIDKIPHNIDLVVGIPRSGMLPATLIALFLNKRLSDVDSFCEGRILPCGETRQTYINHTPIRKVLVVDDSVGQGGSMTKAKQKLRNAVHDCEFIYLAPIVTSIGITFVDLYFEIIDDSRIFEWNLFHHHFLGNACLDIDGVLNVDPEIDDDGPIYQDFLLSARPKFLPTARIDTLITCRLEKYREQTEYWLKKHNIQYNNLVMLDMPDKKTRVTWGRHGEYKGEYYKNNKHILFVESNPTQAKTICKISKKPVYCVETNTLLQPFIEEQYHSLAYISTKYPHLYIRLKKTYTNLRHFIKQIFH